MPGKAGPPAMSAMANLPLSQILRTYLITTVSSSPFLLRTSTSFLRRCLESKSALFSVERNPILRSVLWHTFYRQFCMGETKEQVQRGAEELRQQGYSGIILEYALEVLKDAEGADEAKDVAFWRSKLLETIEISKPGDYVGLKWSGMGPDAMKLMKKDVEPSERMLDAMNAVCTAAAEKNVYLLPAAEETWSLSGFQNWTIRMQRAYNIGGTSVVYSTYQAYLKSMPSIVEQHLELARKEGWTLCLKLVRGAYLASEERSKIYPTIEDTHAAYDGITEALIHRRPNQWIKTPAESWPHINVVLATHNAETVRKAQALRRAQKANGEELTELSFAQLQGMADEVSCTLVAASRAADTDPEAVSEKVFKCTTWGSMFECLNYLLRRAAENKDAASRTADTRKASAAEIGRRFRSVFGLS